MTDDFRPRRRSDGSDTRWHTEDLMARAERLDRADDPTPSGAVPGSRTVPDLEAAIGLVRRLGGSVMSEVRTAPGIGSWAFVTGVDGRELLLWESAPRVG